MGLEGEALPALLHDEGGDAPGADVGGGDGENHVGVRHAAVGDKDLLAVEQPVVALVDGGGLGAARVGAGVGLGEAEGADLLTLGQGNQIFFLLLLGAEGEDGPGAQGHMGGQNHACAAVHPGQLLHRDGIAHNVKPRAAVLLGIGDAHQPHLSQFFYGLGGETALLIHEDDVGLHLSLREGANLGPQLLVSLCGLEQHRETSF